METATAYPKTSSEQAKARREVHREEVMVRRVVSSAVKTLEEMDIERSKPKPNEVLIEVLYCGVCHSDIHQVANDWKNTVYPCVPGHEIVGRVVQRLVMKLQSMK